MACRRKVLGVCVDFVVDPIIDPVRSIRNITGIKVPTSISVGGRSINIDPGIDAQIKQAQTSLRDLKNTGRQAEVDWKNAGRGEIGSYVAKTGEGLYGVVATIPRAIQSGDWERELQRGYGNSRMALSPLENRIGKNQGWQDALRNEDAWYNKWSGNAARNFAGQTRGQAQMQSSGTISKADSNDWQQLSVKAGAVVAAIFGGGAIAGAYGSGGAAGAGGASAAGAGSTAGGLTLPALGSSAGYGATASYGLGSAAVGTGAGAGASLGGGAAAAAGTSWWATGLTSLGTGLATSVGSGLLNRGVGAATDGATNFIGDLFGGTDETASPGYTPPAYFSDPTGNAGSYGGDGVTSDLLGGEGAQQLAVLGAVAVVGYLLYRRFA